MSCDQSRPEVVIAKSGSPAAQGSSKTAPLRRFFADLQASAVGAAIGRTLSVGVAMLGLAAIGTVSISKGAVSSLGIANEAAIATANVLSASAAGAAMSSPFPTASSVPPGQGHGQESAAQESAGQRKVPTDPQESAAPPPPEPDKGAPVEPGLTSDGKIVLNTANATQLDRLPSVGPKRAEQIVALRTRLGKFHSLNELLRIRGIGKRTLAKMLPLLVLDPPQP